MINIYDNGALMLGNIKMVIKEIEKEIANDIDMCCIDASELLKELKETEKELGDYLIVCINYENPMGYTIDYWSDNDIINKYRGE